MGKQTILGIIGTLVGGAITFFSYKQYKNANEWIDIYKVYQSAMGRNQSENIAAAVTRSDNSRIALIVGAIIIVIGLIIFSSGLISDALRRNNKAASEPSQINDTNVSSLEQMKELDSLKESGYISDEEYEQKRKEVLKL